MTTEHIERLLRPADWARNVLNAARSGWPIDDATTNVALVLTGDVEQSQPSTSQDQGACHG